MSFIFGTTVKSTTINVLFDDDHLLKKKVVERKKQTVELFEFNPSNPIKGKVLIKQPTKKPLHHTGIKINLHGVFEVTSSKPLTIVDLSKDLSGPGAITSQQQMFPFEFPPLTEYESYNGNSIRLKYYLTVTVLTKSSAKPNTQVEFLVAIPKDVTEQTAISQQLGIEKIIHFDLNLTKNVYDLDDVVMGSIYIRLLRVKIGRVDVHLVRKEFSGKPQTEKNSSIINTFGIADGQLVKGDILPIRFYLKKIPLTPTFDNIADAYSVRYYLSFVFVDDEDRKYETSLEILLNRFNAPISHEKMIPPVNVIDFERLKDVKELSMGGNADDINEEELLKEIKDEENVKQNDEKQNDDAPLSFGEPITQDDPIEEQNIQNVDESSVQKDDVITSNQEEKIDNVVVGDEPKAEDFIIEEEKKDEEEEKENDKQESIEDMNDSHTPQQESVDNELNNESADVADFISDANE